MLVIRHNIHLLRLRAHLIPTAHHGLSSLRFPSTSTLSYAFGLFRNWRDKEWAITGQIKRTMNSETLMQIIRKKGRLMNLVHVTAILDRMEQQQMVNTGAIVKFAVSRIRRSHLIFKETNLGYARTICNIICYLGNIKNTQLNSLFRLVDFSALVTHTKSIEKAMLITGIIRLGLWREVFGFKGEQSGQIGFEEAITSEFGLNQLLSIWFAVVTQPGMNAKAHLHSMFESLINAKAQSSQQISYREYTYAAICYTTSISHLQDLKSGRLYELVYTQMPSKVQKNKLLLPHQLCLLLTAIKTLTRNGINYSIINRVKSSGFYRVLVDNFCSISGQQYTTLRHIANNFKLLNEMFVVEGQVLMLVVKRIKALLKEQEKILQEKADYQMNNKVDALSLCSLTWKVNSLAEKREEEFEDLGALVELNVAVSELVVKLHRLGLFQKFAVDELLMMYSGFYSFAKIQDIHFPPEFKEVAISTVIHAPRLLTLKQHTLFYTYFKKIQFFSPQFCRFTKQNVEKLCAASETTNQTALSIQKERICIMGLKERCLNCLGGREREKVGGVCAQE